MSTICKSPSIFNTPAFTFLIGKDRSRLTIHAGTVRKISEPLYALINNGQFQESNSRLAVLEDVEEDTFLAFCEFLYTGTYTTPNLMASEDNSKCDLKTVEPSPADEPEDMDASSWPAPKKKKGKKGAHWQEAVTCHNCPYDRLWQSFTARDFAAEPASVSTKPDVLFHAKLYVFATKYLIDSLGEKCLKSLHRDLCVFSLDKNTTSRILELIVLTYERTGRDELGGGSPLRDLVVHYAACKARTLFGGDGELRILLDWNAELGSDLVVKLVT
ncbi:hypothetical protein EMPG_13248 [Blastomyces silverae]|uniref:BTB domain-containing protein n=1 Tax=Blastomyces silverae TaxID=2060906 RepID=A0A0H1BJ83_9EURO|nr:hypothetical protein EMPG_13248 [Blastomyces silverae]